jgi:hypothetical protein
MQLESYANNTLTTRLLSVRPWVLFVFAFLISFAPSHPISGRVWITIWIAAFAWWTMSLGHALHQRMRSSHLLDVKWFRYFVGFATCYAITLFWITNGGYSITSSNAHEYGWKLWLIIPLHLFVMFCMFYSIHFLAKAIKTIRQENGHRDETTFIHILGFWFFPIGIWIIQPRIIEILTRVPPRFPPEG